MEHEKEGFDALAFLTFWPKLRTTSLRGWWICESERSSNGALSTIWTPRPPMTRVAAGRRVTCLERQPDARRYHPRVLRVFLHHRAGANPSGAEGPPALGRVEGAAGEEIGALEIEPSVRGKSPRESEVHLGAEVVRVALHPAVLAHRCSSHGPAARMGAEHAR